MIHTSTAALLIAAFAVIGGLVGFASGYAHGWRHKTGRRR